MNIPFYAEGSLLEALRPRRSGRAVDGHVFASRKEPVADYEKMRRAVHGTEPASDVAPVLTLAVHLHGVPRTGGWTLDRDTELMRLVCESWRPNEIAQDLGVTVQDVTRCFDLLTGLDRETKTRKWLREEVAAALSRMAAEAVVAA